MTTAKDGRSLHMKRMHPNRYLVTVDHRAKRSYESLDEAEAEAKRISDKFPAVCVEVVDSQTNSLTFLEQDPTGADPADDGAEED